MDFFNNEYKEYMRSDDKTLSDTRIHTAVYIIKSFFMAAFLAFFIALPVALSLIEKRDVKQNSTQVTITTAEGRTKEVQIPATPKFESVAEAVQRAERSKARISRLLTIVAVLFVLIWLLKCLHYKSYRFIVAKNGIYEIAGIIFKNIKFVPYGKITDSVLKRGLLDLIFGTGTIGISTAGGTRSYNGASQPYEIRIRNVEDYKKIRELIFKGMK
ncbi:MAG: PH domain-containing protein [Rickettsiales bacterium]|jgi:membrane protein YdbS with pleckstrin-like domain|nr:PH domain-containing protein [Rickettsiales bacterium]